MYGEIFQAVKRLALEHAAPYTAISTGAMPEENGLAMYLGPGAPLERHLDRGGTYDVTIALNGKNSDQQAVVTALSGIHFALSQMRNYPQTDRWQIASIETQAAPNYLDREDSNTRQWLYGSSLRVYFYVKGVC